jgi:hypothetical protein
VATATNAASVLPGPFLGVHPVLRTIGSPLVEVPQLT